MARKNPVGKLAETAMSTFKDPKGAAGKVVDQAKGTAALGKLLADTAGTVVGKAAGEAAGRLRGRKAQGRPGVPSQRPGAQARPASVPATRPGDLRAVPDVNEPGRPAPAESMKKHGEALETGAATAKTAPAAKKPSAKQAPAAKKQAPAAKKGAAKKAPAKKAAPAARKGAKKAGAKKVAGSPADVAEVVEAAVAEDASRTAAKPAKKAPAAKKGAAKTPAKKASPGGRLPAKKAAPKKAAAKKAPAKKAAPKSAAEVAANEGEDVRTPSGTPAFSEGANPSTGDTSLTQPGTPPAADEAVAKSVTSESEQLRRAAERNPE